MLYQLGAMTFEVYPLNVGTVEREGGSDYAAKDIVGAHRPREFVGEADEKVKLSGFLYPHKFGGVAQLSALQAIAKMGVPQLLLRGDGSLLGWFIIEKVTDKHTYIDRVGVGRMIEFEVELVKSPVGASAGGMAFTLLSLFG